MANDVGILESHVAEEQHSGLRPSQISSMHLVSPSWYSKLPKGWTSTPADDGDVLCRIRSSWDQVKLSPLLAPKPEPSLEPAAEQCYCELLDAQCRAIVSDIGPVHCSRAPHPLAGPVPTRLLHAGPGRLCRRNARSRRPETVRGDQADQKIGRRPGVWSLTSTRCAIAATPDSSLRQPGAGPTAVRSRSWRTFSNGRRRGHGVQRGPNPRAESRPGLAGIESTITPPPSPVVRGASREVRR
jgi:hypothetical protein